MSNLNCSLFIQSLPTIPIHDEVSIQDNTLYYSYVFIEILKYKNMSWNSANSSALSVGIPLGEIMGEFGFKSDNSGWSKFISEIQNTTKRETLIKRVNKSFYRKINNGITDALNTCMLNDNQSLLGLSVVPIPSAAAPTTFSIILDYNIYTDSPKYLDIELESSPLKVAWGEVDRNGDYIYSHKHSIRLYSRETVMVTKRQENLHDDTKIVVRTLTPIPAPLQRIPPNIIFPKVPKELPVENYLFKLTTITANGKKSDTDDIFLVKIIGDKGKSDFIVLNNKGNDRERNETDVYHINTKKSLGVVKSLIFKGRKNKKAKQIDDWTIKKLTLADMETGKVYKSHKPYAIGDGSLKNPINSRKVVQVDF